VLPPHNPLENSPLSVSGPGGLVCFLANELKFVSFVLKNKQTNKKI
jgi:hypothetical protein